MLIVKYILLGLIQGLTEFLPVSSSAHLVLFRELFKLPENRILLEIVLHLGTLAALIIFLFKDIQRLLDKKTVALVLLATALTALVVIIGSDFFESLFSAPRKLAGPLVLTGIILLSSKRYTQGSRSWSSLNPTDAAWLGLIQGLAVIPGLSRSGLTISSLLFRGVQRETAVKFSLLVSALAIIGALVFKIKDFVQLSSLDFAYMAWGFLAAFFSGLLALKILLKAIRQARFYLFGYYCLGLSLILLLV